MSEHNGKHGTFQLSQDRQVMQARIRARFDEHKDEPDYCLPYAELSALVGADVQSDSNLNAKLSAAVRSVAKEMNIVLARDRTRGGIVRLRTGLYPTYIDDRTKRIRRAAHRTATECARIASHAGLSDAERTSLYARGSIAAAIAAFSGRKSLAAKVEGEVVRSGNQPISLARTLSAFNGSKE